MKKNVLGLMGYLLLATLAFAQHSVSLSWVASPTQGVTYTLNRGTATGQETAYQSGIATTSYVDTAVQAGATYFYTVDAVCPGVICGAGTSGTSKASNEVSATIPSNLPAPPTGLTVTQTASNPPKVTDTWAISTMPDVIRQFVLRQTSGGPFVAQKQLMPPITSFVDTTVKKGKTYSYEIEAEMKNRATSISQPLSITVQ